MASRVVCSSTDKVSIASKMLSNVKVCMVGQIGRLKWLCLILLSLIEFAECSGPFHEKKSDRPSLRKGIKGDRTFYAKKSDRPFHSKRAIDLSMKQREIDLSMPKERWHSTIASRAWACNRQRIETLHQDSQRSPFQLLPKLDSSWF
jgi:hypothetical protein